MIKDLGYTSVDKSLRTCEHFDTSIYLQDRQLHDERRRMWLKFSLRTK